MLRNGLLALKTLKKACWLECSRSLPHWSCSAYSLRVWKESKLLHMVKHGYLLKYPGSGYCCGLVVLDTILFLSSAYLHSFFSGYTVYVIVYNVLDLLAETLC